jgi:hypothetical protein
MRSILRLFALLIIAGLPHISALQAQAVGTLNAFQRAQIAQRIPVRLVLVSGSSLQASTARVQRNAALGSDVVIVRKEDASPRLIAEAMFMLMRLQEQDGDVATASKTTIVTEGVLPARVLRSEITSAEAVLRRTSAAPRSTVSGIGSNVQVATLHLPSQALRTTLKAQGRLGLFNFRRIP